MNNISNILFVLNENFPPKEGCSNAIYYSADSPCGIALQLWISKEKFMCFFLDNENELNDLEKLISDIKLLLINAEVTDSEVKL